MYSSSDWIHTLKPFDVFTNILFVFFVSSAAFSNFTQKNSKWKFVLRLFHFYKLGSTICTDTSCAFCPHSHTHSHSLTHTLMQTDDGRIQCFCKDSEARDKSGWPGRWRSYQKYMYSTVVRRQCMMFYLTLSLSLHGSRMYKNLYWSWYKQCYLSYGPPL